VIYLKFPVNGIDIPIQLIQQEVYDELLCKWQLQDSDWQCFGRVYKKAQPKGGYLPEAFVGGAGGDYEPVLLDDKYAVSSFFAVNDIYKADGFYNKYQVRLIFMVDLGRIYSGNETRPDAEARDAVQAAIGDNCHGFTVTSVITTVPKVFAEYTISRAGVQQDGSKSHDVHPYHVFAIEGDLLWDSPIRANDYE
jgi:hypothetical protein